MKKVDSGDLLGPSSDYYASFANFHNADNTTYVGGKAIWEWMRRLFGAFRRVSHEPRLITEIRSAEDGPDAESTIYMETVTHFWLLEDADGSEPAVVPRIFRFRVGAAEHSKGTQGFQIREGSVWWDTGILAKKSSGTL